MRMEFTAIRDLKRANSRNLIFVAVLLRRESGALLVGDRTDRGIIRRMRKIICDDSSVDIVGDLLTMWTSDFAGLWMYRNLNSLSIRIEKDIRQQEPTVRLVFIEVDLPRSASKIVDSGETMSSRPSTRMKNSQKRIAL